MKLIKSILKGGLLITTDKISYQSKEREIVSIIKL